MRVSIFIILFLNITRLFGQSDTLYLINGDTIIGSIFSENKFIVKMKVDTGWVFIQHSEIFQKESPQKAIQTHIVAQAQRSPRSIEIPAGEFLVIRTNRKLTTKFAQSDEFFECRIVQSITDRNGDIIIPANTPAIGRVKYSVNGTAFRKAALELELVEIHLFGTKIPIATNDNVTIVQNYTAQRVLGSATTGSIIGGILYNEWLRGALIGAAIGVVTSLIIEDRDIVVPENSALQFMIRDKTVIRRP